MEQKLDDLKKLLDLSQLHTEEEIKKRFETLANELLMNYQIKKGNDSYKFLEIEFYYCTKGHLDLMTYPRNADAGMWFFHNSGVDITFKSTTNSVNDMVDTSGDFYFGGILVRSLRKNDKEVICGPLNCVDDLFDKFSCLRADGAFLVQEKKNTEIEISAPRERYIELKDDESRLVDLKKKYTGDLGVDKDKFIEYNKLPYRFYVKDSKEEFAKVKHKANPWK